MSQTTICKACGRERPVNAWCTCPEDLAAMQAYEQRMAQHFGHDGIPMEDVLPRLGRPISELASEVVVTDETDSFDTHDFARLVKGLEFKSTNGGPYVHSFTLDFSRLSWLRRVLRSVRFAFDKRPTFRRIAWLEWKGNRRSDGNR